MNFNIFFSGYFQSTLRPVAAIVVCLLRGLVLSSILVATFPLMFGTDAIWYAVPVAELLTFLVAMAFLYFHKIKKSKAFTTT